MKRNILLVLAALMLFASCSTNYVVTDNVSRHLNGTRTILSADTTSLAKTPYGLWQRTLLESPQSYDFRTMRDTMRYAYSQLITPDNWTVNCDTISRMLRPEVNVNKHFRWFTTRYNYSARFHHLDSLPVPISEYLSEDEQRLLFNANELPNDWNGADLYALLDDLNTKYMKWSRHCTFEKEYEICSLYADSAQRILLAQYHDTILTLTLGQEFIPDQQESLEKKARLFPELKFVSNLYSKYEIQDKVAIWFQECCESDTRILWRVELPGDCSREYMISGERLITDNYVINLSSRVINWWAVTLTLLLAAIPLIAVFCSKKRRG